MTFGFDAMAVAVDWLDAYRAAKLDAMLDLYDDNSSLECGCGGQKTLIGKAALKQYWIQRFSERAALELDDIQPVGDDVAVTYQTNQGLVRVVFSFSAVGKISRTQCGPAAAISRQPPPSH
jgi:hypothetical protein